MKTRLTAHTEADLLRGIDWFDRISTGHRPASRGRFHGLST
jgi:hypothetical protein